MAGRTARYLKPPKAANLQLGTRANLLTYSTYQRQLSFAEGSGRLRGLRLALK
jgi:hypothetical protein